LFNLTNLCRIDLVVSDRFDEILGDRPAPAWPKIDLTGKEDHEKSIALPHDNIDIALRSHRPVRKRSGG
jgi:hypothetical protein